MAICTDEEISGIVSEKPINKLTDMSRVLTDKSTNESQDRPNLNLCLLSPEKVISPRRKHKLANESSHPSYMHPFLIYPCTNSPLSVPIAVTPIKAISASSPNIVPLNVLLPSFSPLLARGNTRRDHGGYQRSTRMFRAAIQDWPEKNTLLFVKVDEKKCLAVIEMVEPGLYMFTQLPSSVKVKDIRALSKVSMTEAAGTPTKKVKVTPAESIAKPKFNLCLEPPPLPSRPVSTADKTNSRKSDQHLQQPGYWLLPVSPKAVSAKDLLRQFQHLYFETLYFSRSPLTFFAKLGISRFRALCNNDSRKIVIALGEMLQTVAEADYKYRNGIPDMLNSLEMKYGVTVDIAECEEVETQTNSSTSNNQTHAPSERFYQTQVNLNRTEQEKIIIRRWWNREEKVRKVSTRGEAINKLKRRETKMQAILVLEILSQEHTLELTSAEKTKPKGKENSKTTNKTKNIKRKMIAYTGGLDLRLLLDVLFDRLQIWQAVSSLDDLLGQDSPEKKQKQNFDIEDDVTSFFVSVVLPFYGTRLPKETKKLHKKCSPQASKDQLLQQPLIDRQRLGDGHLARRSKSFEGVSHSHLSERGKGTKSIKSNSFSEGLLPSLTSASSLSASSLKLGDFARRRKGIAVRGGLMVSSMFSDKRRVEIVTGARQKIGSQKG
ncbi:DNA replication regulator SLD3-domain-containing protein [Lipomyces oligophaga]|uniref:DNA replication regulator SLD3-domain-containing protein n=1 Tax=Lipomyces oligophaga TaxID=45792 RepID=UPI0034CE250F